MNSQDGRSGDSVELRRLAEEKAASLKMQDMEGMSSAKMQQMFHELQVHQIELAMQNEELRRTQVELDAARERYLDLYELAPVGYLTVNEKGMILEANITAATLLDVARGVMVKHPFSQFILKEDQDIYYRHRKQLFETGTPHTCELRMLKKDGAVIWVRLEAIAALESDGISVCRVVMSDMTERKQIDEVQTFLLQCGRQHSGDNFFKSLAHYLGETLRTDFVCIDRLTDDYLSAQTVAIYFDGHFEDNVAYTLKDTPCGDVVGKMICCFPRGVRHLYPNDVVLQEMKAEGYVGTTIWSNEGKPIGLIALIWRKPLTNSNLAEAILKLVAVRVAGELERIVAEQEKAKLQAQLVQAQKMEAIGTLAGGIAHDFNNVLWAIMGFTELTLNALKRDTKEYHNLQQVLTASERAKDLIKQILAFSRKTDQEKKSLELSLIVKEAVNLLRATIPTTIEIKQEISSSQAMVLADHSQMHQVMMNLCTNAAYAMYETGGILAIKLEEKYLDKKDLLKYADLNQGPYVVLTVSDTGHGIAPELLDRIFDPFFTTKEVGKGTGMGLAVVYGIVKSHGGGITVTSQLGIGTSFTILLPKIIVPDVSVVVPPAPIPYGSASILVIDDEIMLVDLIKDMLESLGYEVVAINSSLEALKMFQTQPKKFDLVITDQTMPHMTGMQLSQELRYMRPDIPVILCTGYSETVSQEKATAFGINALLMKPIVFRSLAETVQKILVKEDK